MWALRFVIWLIIFGAARLTIGELNSFAELDLWAKRLASVSIGAAAGVATWAVIVLAGLGMKVLRGSMGMDNPED